MSTFGFVDDIAALMMNTVVSFVYRLSPLSGFKQCDLFVHLDSMLSRKSAVFIPP